MKRVLAISMLLLTPLMFGCATVRGMGKDIESTGEWIQRNVSNDRNETNQQDKPDKLTGKTYSKQLQK